MDKYIVKLLPKAYADIEEVYKYISQNFLEKEIALKIVDGIEETIFSLESLPYRGAKRECGKYIEGYRQLIYKNFTIIYRIDEINISLL